ncbi:hypothetical protein B4113_3531 [Geobacillus sp. B4113_201601]|nr:hypothetical protein B4113_3531 [Geobacillus sp. B4113_201601]
MTDINVRLFIFILPDLRARTNQKIRLPAKQKTIDFGRRTM